MNPPIIIALEAPFQIERRRLPDDPELAPGAAVVGAYIANRLIARCAEPEDWTVESDRGLLDEPRQVRYSGSEDETGTITAELAAIIPAADIPREPWEPEPDDETPGGVLPLGIVVRLPADRTGEDFTTECVKHLLAAIVGDSEPVVDRILKRL